MQDEQEQDRQEVESEFHATKESSLQNNPDESDSAYTFFCHEFL